MQPTDPSLPAANTAPSPSFKMALPYVFYYRSDGFQIATGVMGVPPIQINGVRAFNATLGTWTTPDAYEGDIRDPASQQRYMWNRDNAYDYSDPSGYCPMCIPVVIVGGQIALDALGAIIAISIAKSEGHAPQPGTAGAPGNSSAAPQPQAQPGSAPTANGNPYKGPVDKPVTAVDSHGNAIPVETGEQIGSSPDAQYQHVRDSKGNQTGTSLHRGGHAKQPDPKAQGPHGHRPGVTDSTGNPHLPVY
jgi:hypothetical protein